MKVYVVYSYDASTKCFDSYEEAEKYSKFLSLTHNAASIDVHEVELQQQCVYPNEFFVRGLARIPYIGIAKGEENVGEHEKMSHHIEIKSEIDEVLEDIKRYEDTTSTILYSSYISIYFYFKLPFIENEDRADLYKRAEQAFFERLDKFKSKKEYEEVIKISQIYSEMSDKISSIAKTIDK